MDINLSKLGITPGAWHINERGFGERNDHMTVYATDDELRYVARCEDYANIKPTDNGANARIISVSPDMLKAHIEDINIMRSTIDYLPTRKQKIIRSRIRAKIELIKEATGKPWREVKEILK